MTKEYIENKLELMRKAWPTASAEKRTWLIAGANILKEKLRKIELEE